MNIYKSLSLLLLAVMAVQLAATEDSLLGTRVAGRRTTQTTSYYIVPILECIDVNNKAYFTYNNNVGVPVTLGLSDRNKLMPLGIAPITTFFNGSGPVFPYSSQISLAGYGDSFYWDLEEYRVSFEISAALSCPKRFNLTFVYTLPSDQVEQSKVLVKEVFLNVTGVAPSRLNTSNTVYYPPTSKRSNLQSIFPAVVTLEIQLADGTNSSEPTAAEVVNDFVENQKQEELTEAVQNKLPYVTLNEFTPKSGPTPSIEGQIRPPMSFPIAEPLTTPIEAPISALVSSAPFIGFNSLLCFTIIIVMRRM